MVLVTVNDGSESVSGVMPFPRVLSYAVIQPLDKCGCLDPTDARLHGLPDPVTPIVTMRHAPLRNGKPLELPVAPFLVWEDSTPTVVKRGIQVAENVTPDQRYRGVIRHSGMAGSLLNLGELLIGFAIYSDGYAVLGFETTAD